MDYIGTLVNAHQYSLDNSRLKLHNALTDAGFKTDLKEFLRAYTRAHEKYRIVRYEELREVTNAVWVSEALNSLGCKVTAQEPSLKAALNVFFKDFVDSLELRPYAKKLIESIAENWKLGLVSNFTYAPVVYASLSKLGINQFFSAVVVSDEKGWRKPYESIFQEALRRLQVTAKEAIFIGDSPLEDIKGAKASGMKTVFVSSQFYTLKDLYASRQKPDLIAGDLHEIWCDLPKILAMK